MANKVAIKKETLDRLGANFQESRGIADKLTLEQMIEYAAQPPATGENRLNQLVTKTITEVTAKDLEGATSIGDYMFKKCPLLTKVTIPNGVTSIESSAFRENPELAIITIPDSVLTISSYAFYQCKKLKNIYYDGNIASWCNMNFYDTHGNPTYNKAALYIKNTNGTYELLEHLIIPDTVITMNNYMFYGCSSLISVIIPDSVTKISSDAFSRCNNLTSVTIGNGVTEVSGYAFYDCTALTSITIPNNVTKISSQALRIGLDNTKATITFLGTIPPSISSNTFIANYLEKIIVPKGCAETYKTATNWANFADYIEEAAE